MFTQISSRQKFQVAVGEVVTEWQAEQHKLDRETLGNPRPINVHFPAIVKGLAAKNNVGTVEVDGWIHTHPIRGFVYKAPTAAAVA